MRSYPDEKYTVHKQREPKARDVEYIVNLIWNMFGGSASSRKDKG